MYKRQAFVLICGVSGGKADELLPVLEESGFNLTKAVIVVLFWFYPLEYILVSMPYIKDRTSLKKKTVSSVLISGVLCALVFTLTLIRFGAPQMRSLTFSVLEMMYSVSLPASFIERQEEMCIRDRPIGIMDSAESNSTELRLSDNDVIVMVTDGVTEAAPCLLGKEKWFAQVIEKYSDLQPDKLCDKLLEEAVRAGKGRIRDDMTVIAAKIWRVC